MWKDKNTIGLAPVDGVSDAAFRQVTDEYGKPDFMYTEFIPTEGLYRGREVLLAGLKRHKSKTPIYAQFFGPHPKFYMYAFFVAAELGFTGIDVNMGCPDTNIVKKGGGAALLLDLPRAKEIIATLISARTDWANGKRLADTDLPENMKAAVDALRINPTVDINTRLSISVKTRIGYHESQVKEVIPTLIDAGVERIALHGRTFDARYSGQANWEEIARAKELTKGSNVTLFGSGDVQGRKMGEEMIRTYGVDGVLIARAAFGNPWVFTDEVVSFEKRKEVMLYHARLFLQYRPDFDLRPMRKHLSWYCKGMEGSAKLRDQLMKVVTLSDLTALLQ
ncbi:MAG: tRNA-dihydrouridine synthase [Microgenomates group bacterium]